MKTRNVGETIEYLKGKGFLQPRNGDEGCVCSVLTRVIAWAEKMEAERDRAVELRKSANEVAEMRRVALAETIQRADAAEDRLAAMEWISVKDAHPSEPGLYPVWCKAPGFIPGVQIGQWAMGGDFPPAWVGQWAEHYTHWRKPTPAPEA